MIVKKQAKKYKRQILEYYDAVPAKIELDFYRVVDDLFIFQIDPMPGTTEDKIRKYLRELKRTLGLQLFQLHSDESGELFFVLSEHNSFDNRLLGILTSPSYPAYTKDMTTPYAIGFNVMRRPVVVDLVTHIHWLLGGSSSSGKTVGVECLITGVAYSCSPEDVNLIIFDGAANLTQFDAIPHLSCPVIQDSDTGSLVIKALYEEMEKRITTKNEDIETFNKLPFIVCVLDEFVSFVSGIGDKQMACLLPDIISGLLRRGRHSKIHLVLAAQDPVIKDMKCDLGNATARLAFTCAKPHYSVTILGEGGAEKLSGNGEMYFKSPKHQGLQYIKGAYITPDEIRMVCDHIRTRYDEAKWDDSYKFVVDIEALRQAAVVADIPVVTGAATTQDIDDKILAKIIKWTIERNTVSANAIDQAFKNIGARKASRIIDRLYKLGIAGEANGKLGRKVLPVCIEDLSSEVIDFLDRHGYTTDDIEKAFDTKPIISDNDDSKDLDLIMDYVQTECETISKTPTISALCELESLIGLGVVKTKVKEIATFLERRGKKNANICLHMCFRGNPGVGKTTVARIIARIFYEAGIIKKNLLVETDRGGLCGRYVGETAIKTNKKIQSAMGGVLFVDEAYSLFSGLHEDFGNEAVATLVKQMEDKRDKFVCIFAGYTNEMNSMLDMNPGLSDRIQFYIDFPDYNENELLQIFEKLCKDNKYELSKIAKDTIIAKFSCVVAAKSRNFSNGRFVRKIFERVQIKQGNRTCDDTITDEDIKAVFMEPDILALLENTISCEES